jgi:hypothetical protein
MRTSTCEARVSCVPPANQLRFVDAQTRKSRNRARTAPRRRRRPGAAGAVPRDASRPRGEGSALITDTSLIARVAQKISIGTAHKWMPCAPWLLPPQRDESIMAVRSSQQSAVSQIGPNCEWPRALRTPNRFPHNL